MIQFQALGFRANLVDIGVRSMLGWKVHFADHLVVAEANGGLLFRV